jgi:hypothetical protein
MLNLCSIVAAISKMATGRNFSMSGINSGHLNLHTYEMSLKSDNVEFVRYCGGHFDCPISSKFYMWVDNDVPNYFPTLKLSTSRHFQNGRHNTANIQHCPISSKFDIWVDNDVPNWLTTLKKWLSFWKWRPVEIFRCRESIQDIIIYLHMTFRWNRTMLNLCGIVAAILRMATGRIFSMSGINSGSPFSKWPPQYRTNSTLSDFNDISYVCRLWCPELIPDIEKILPVAILKMAATIPHKFNIVFKKKKQKKTCKNNV